MNPSNVFAAPRASHRTRTIRLACAVLAAFLIMPASSRDKPDLVLPKARAFTPAALQQGDDYKFEGRSWVSGRFVARWHAGVDSKAENIVEYFIIPDAASVSRLPYVRINAHDYRVESIEVRNGAAALRNAMGSREAWRLLRHETSSAESSGSFLIGNYQYGIECDAPWALASVLSSRNARPVAVSGSANRPGC